MWIEVKDAIVNMDNVSIVWLNNNLIQLLDIKGETIFEATFENKEETIGEFENIKKQLDVPLIY